MKKGKSLDEMSLEELIEESVLQRVERRNKLFRLINLLIFGALIGTIIFFFF
mgnify:CR=1 FL=1|tara:strand:+ start:224 stop:379 length:156 start_codon:yes stop_codon:yes gene_type:complete